MEEEAKRMLDHWFEHRKTFKCVPPKGATYDYRIVEGKRTYAQVSFHPNGILARWARCFPGDVVPHGKVTYWTPEGVVMRVCDYNFGKRDGLDIYYTDGVPTQMTSYRNGRKDGLDSRNGKVTLYRRGKAMLPKLTQGHLNLMAAFGFDEELKEAFAYGISDNGQALAAAAHEGLTSIVSLLLSMQTYSDWDILEAWTQAFETGKGQAVALLRPRLLPLVSQPIDLALGKRNLEEATELVALGFRPNEWHLIIAAEHGEIDVVTWCLQTCPDMRTYKAWSFATDEQCARILEPAFYTTLRKVSSYAQGLIGYFMPSL